jgi:segregation and condensation protein B
MSGAASAEQMRTVLEELEAHYRHRGLNLHLVAGGYQFRTHPENAQFVQKLIAGKPVRLSRAQLETLAIVAYRQPITRPEIDEIRGVESASTVRVLLERDLVRVLGKKEEPGRPLLYGTTREFLQFFNLNDLRDLPTLREYHELSDDSLREVERLGGAAPTPSVAAEVPEPEAESGILEDENGPNPDEESAVQDFAQHAEHMPPDSFHEAPLEPVPTEAEEAE